MADASHYFSADLQFSAAGDLLLSEGPEQSKQWVLRRLMTNPRDYLWQPDYGAGLPSYVGAVLDQAELTALVRSQMYLEQSVQPVPDVAFQQIPNGAFAQLRYSVNDQDVTLNFSVVP